MVSSSPPEPREPPLSLLPLRLENALVRRGANRLAGPISLTIEGGGITILAGANGAGKTTFLRMMHGIERLSSGTVSWATPARHARMHQAFVFQNPVILRRTVLENLIYPLRLTGVSKPQARARALAACTDIGLADHALVRATRLSGGERQKLALARALIRAPQVLFLDEPCASLDGTATRDIETLLLRAAADGVRIIMSTHSPGQARRLASEMLFMHGGKLLCHCPAEQFFSAPPTQETRAWLKGEIYT